MKKLLLGSVAAVALCSGSAAMAADMRPAPAPVYTKAPMMAPAFSWSGFYIGGNIGGAWSHGDVTDSLFGLNFSNGNNNGVFIGGGQVGLNYQISNFVIGAEADFDWAANNNNNGNGVVVPGVGTFRVNSNNNWISTAAARFGVAYEHWLFYGKAGGGWVGNTGFTVTNVGTGASFSSSNNSTTTGWLVGGGVEWAFSNNWSAKIEYDFLGLSGQTFNSTGVVLAGDRFSTSNPNIQMVKFGVNYRFGMIGM
jgi:outer membrane immunogenic protein